MASQWWGIEIAAVTALIFLLQLFVFGRQARRLKETIDKMDEISAKQGEDMVKSIAESVRSADAMDRVATTLIESTEISQEIADRQKLVTELGGRAYLYADFQTAVYQTATLNFEGVARIANRGNTPAYDVTFRAKADLIPFPAPENFDFPLPDDTAGSSSSLIAPGVEKIIRRVVAERVPDDQIASIKIPQPPRCLAMWGIVNYRDAFKEARYVKFAFIIQWIEMAGKDKDGNPLKPLIMSADMAHHNEAN